MVKSMFAAVAGLRAHQSRMDVIGNNIANVNTFGYKKARATFKDQFYATMNGASAPGQLQGGGNPSQIGYGSQVGSIDVAHTQGGIAATDIPTDVMISGNGYFMVGDYNEEGFSTSKAGKGDDPTALNLTRVGIFFFDGAGSLVDGNRNHVYGFKAYTDAAGNVSYGRPSTPAGAEKKLEALSIPKTVPTTAGGATIKIAGKTVTPQYKADGTYDSAATLTEANKLIPKKDDGAGGMVPDYSTISPDVKDNTEFEALFTGSTLAAAKLNSVSIGADGVVSGVDENKNVVIVGKIAVANVPNPNALESTSNGYYKAKENTGLVTAEVPGEGSTGGLLSGKLEMANVDLSQEFTDMITTQRGFQANTRIITVTDQMLEELVNLKR